MHFGGAMYLATCESTCDANYIRKSDFPGYFALLLQLPAHDENSTSVLSRNRAMRHPSGVALMISSLLTVNQMSWLTSSYDDSFSGASCACGSPFCASFFSYRLA
jgi:hypothetical protein